MNQTLEDFFFGMVSKLICGNYFLGTLRRGVRCTLRLREVSHDPLALLAMF